MTFSQKLDRFSLHFVKISLQIANCREENPSRRAGAADMTQERALNPQREPQNWILHHGNYQGHSHRSRKSTPTR
jgi:hypothetical protein